MKVENAKRRFSKPLLLSHAVLSCPHRLLFQFSVVAGDSESLSNVCPHTQWQEAMLLILLLFGQHLVRIHL